MLIVACEETGYVFEEPEGSATLSQYANGVAPEVSIVESSEALAGLGVRLTGEAARDDVDLATPRLGVEGADVGVDGELLTRRARLEVVCPSFAFPGLADIPVPPYASCACIVGHIAAPRAQDSLAVGVSLHSADCSESEEH
jgi:hypothetical protein